MPELHHSRLREIDAETLYRMLWLRVTVFVVEQAAAYAELDGRDLEAETELFGVSDDVSGGVLATLRLLDDGDAARIGRVATATSARGAGLAADLMRRAIARSTEKWPERPIHLDAQAHLAAWYERFGFGVSGPGFEEDEIPHVPMTRVPDPARPGTSPARPSRVGPPVSHCSVPLHPHYRTEGSTRKPDRRSAWRTSDFRRREPTRHRRGR